MSESISRSHENDQPVLETHDKRTETRACDLISRQAAVDEITEYGSGKSIYMSVGELKRRIETLPSAQPEIIHCRNCKWHNGEINQCNAQICASMCGEDFCSRAERREDG